MGTTWDDRLTNVVFPALLAGIPVYTAVGELRPGQGLPQTDAKGLETLAARTKKPAGLPVWQVYLAAKATQPAIRFLQFVHRGRNPTGSAVMVYPTRLRDEKLGVPLIIPLGEGMETPGHEMFIARELEASIIHRLVKIIALHRVRFFTTTSPWSLVEPVIMEVYSEVGDLIWTNPFIGIPLEEAIAKCTSGESFFTTCPSTSIKNAAPPMKRRLIEADLGYLIALGLPGSEVKAQIARMHGFELKIASRLYDAHQAKPIHQTEIQEVVRHYAAQLEGLYEGDEFLKVVAEDSGQSIDQVREVLRKP